MKKKFAFDVILNIIASAIPVAILQLIILPDLAKRVDVDEYAIVVTFLSIFNLISVSFGNVLNNVRLINEKRHWKSYNFNLLVLGVINIILLTVLSFYYYDKVGFLILILNLITGSLWYLKEYLIVAFRIVINYKNILISSIILSIGHCIGYGVFIVTGYWQMIYLIGFALCLVFIALKSDIWKEKIVKAEDFREMSKQSWILMTATVLGRIPTYADRMLIYPLLGASDTVILYISTLIGKLVSMAITPLSAVILTYLAKIRKKDNTVFTHVIIASLVTGIVGYFLCLVISSPILGVLYPDYIGEVIHYLPVTTGTVVLTALISIVDPFLINYIELKWQIVINVFYNVCYLVISLLLLNKYALYGFCIGSLITMILRLIFEIVLFYVVEQKRYDEDSRTS